MGDQKLSAQELLRACLTTGGESLWNEFMRAFQPMIASVIVKTLRRWGQPDAALVDDLVQETFLKLCAHNFRALREIQSNYENAVFGFIKVVASNIVQDHYRKFLSQKRGSGKGEEDLELAHVSAVSDSSFSEKLEKRDQLGQIDECLKTFAAEPNFERDYAIFWLFHRQGLTAKEISELPTVELTVKGVESTLLRLARLLRSKLNEAPKMR
ncbi:MAG TPA: sigma-70 family RNA polymerase sigma factor [Candidatus Angelobacter sp.]|jgi:RNA polymerase sigma-70 factor (ECF subfamily)|nr:sigma-70 family RNA polymerase sigma factor [Candidatus Angelobacter sp.]